MQHFSSSMSTPKSQRHNFDALRRYTMLSLLGLAVLILAACSGTAEPTSPAESPRTLAFEAENAEVTNGVFAIVADIPASASAALMQPASVKANRVPVEDASIRFEVPRDDTWTLWSRLRADTRAGDSVFVGFDGELAQANPGTLGQYVWLRITSEELREGQHRISIGHADGTLKLDMLIVTNNTDVTPAELEVWRASNEPPASPVPTIEPQ